MFGIGHGLDDLQSTKNLIVQNINDICAACLQQHESGRTSSMCDMLPVEDAIEIYKLLESISLFRYSEKTPQLLCSTCSYKLLNIYEFQQMCNRSFSYLNNYIKQKDAQYTSKLEIGDIEMHDFYRDSEDVSIADTFETDNGIEELVEEAKITHVSKEQAENKEKQVVINEITESTNCIDTESPSIVPLETTKAVLPTRKIVNTDLIDIDIGTNKSISNVDSSNIRKEPYSEESEILSRDLELTSMQSSNPDTCMKKDPKLHRQMPNIPSNGTNKGKKRTGRKYVCKYCNKVVQGTQSFKYHIDMHEDVRNCVCIFCGLQFRTPGALTIHERKHTGEKPYKCDHCEKRYLSKNLLTCHAQRHHRPDDLFCCEVCGKKAKVKKDLKQHMKIHTNDRPHKCLICSKTYIQKVQLTLHMARHANDSGKDKSDNVKEKKYKCTQCEKTFACGRYLGRHRREVHCEEPRYTCNLCDNKYKSAKALRNHVLVHSGIRAHVCTYCNKDFVRKSGLTTHIQLVHNK